MPRNDQTFLSLFRLLDKKSYLNKWQELPDNNYAKVLLKHASKENSGEEGLPDFSYINEKERLLILGELKTTVAQQKNAIKDIKHYLQFFNENIYPKEDIFCYNDEEIKTALHYFSNFNIIGIAVSGNISIENGHKIDTYMLNTINGNCVEISDLQINEIKNEKEYINLLKNTDKENLVENISKTSSWINNLLYEVKEDKRPTLISILLISLFPSEKVRNDFRDDYVKSENDEIFDDIRRSIKRVLGVKGEQIPEDKIKMIEAEIESFKTEKALINSSVIKTILDELKNNVIPLFNLGGNYDIIGKFYQEFLRYAGIVDVQSGIVLTPEHITELFTDLVKVRKDDVFLDCCCGTGSFLVSAMYKLLSLQSNKKEEDHVRKYQLIGNEIKTHMYILSISNMLFRGDGKSNILNEDFFSENFDRELEKLIDDNGVAPTIGFINPPYSGSFTDYTKLQEFKKESSKKSKNKNKKPWMKEISFLKKLCDICSRYVVMIAPPQAFMSEEDIRTEILKKHTLKAIIHMPKDLFQPNASTGSAIVVIKTNEPHDYEKSVVFYNLKDDGFELTKRKGRRDVYLKWENSIKKDLLTKIDAPNYSNINKENVDNIDLCYLPVKKDSEWVIQAYSKTDYSKLEDSDFINNIKEYLVFNAKNNLNILFENINEITLFENMYNFYGESIVKLQKSFVSKKVDTEKWVYFDLGTLFEVNKGTRLTKKDRKIGEIPLVTAGYLNQGISEYISNEDMQKYNNSITIDMFSNVFYRDYEFCCDDNIIVLSNDILKNKYIALFVITMILQDKFRYSYDRQYRLKHNNKHLIKLPPINDKKGNVVPDWNSMEKYIKTLPYSDLL